MALPDSFSHYVFVDFENVPTVDLSSLGDRQVHVTLLLGKQQTRIDTALFRQALQHADRISVIDVGVSGRNALDMVLAAYLGRASHEHPEARFTVVSKDKDFDPLLAHLQANDVSVNRDPNFFSRHPKPAHPPSPAGARPGRTKPRAVPGVPDDKLQMLVTRFTTGTGPLPRNKGRLLHDLAAHLGNKLSDAQLESAFAELVRRGIVVESENGRMRYPQRETGA